MHGHIFIMLKDSLRYLPVIGPGMMFFGFIFMARNWGKDKPRMQHRLQNLNTQHDGPMSGPRGLDPMWLLIFPEGTNLSKNGRNGSAKWAEKAGLQDLQHALLPRYMGLQFCLQELEKTVDWVYDCTVAYEGVPYVQCSPSHVLDADRKSQTRRTWPGCVQSTIYLLPRPSATVCQHVLAPLRCFFDTHTRP